MTGSGLTRRTPPRRYERRRCRAAPAVRGAPALGCAAPNAAHGAPVGSFTCLHGLQLLCYCIFKCWSSVFQMRKMRLVRHPAPCWGVGRRPGGRAGGPGSLPGLARSLAPAAPPGAHPSDLDTGLQPHRWPDLVPFRIYARGLWAEGTGRHPQSRGVCLLPTTRPPRCCASRWGDGASGLEQEAEFSGAAAVVGRVAS